MIALLLTLAVGFIAGWMVHDAIMARVLRTRFDDLSKKFRLYPK